MELVQYTVRQGNTLYAIAQFFQTTVNDILQYNNIQNPSMIYPGMELTIPAGSGGGDYYVVRPGDSLWSIAQRYGTTVPELTRLSKLNNPNLVYPGQVLRVR